MHLDTGQVVGYEALARGPVGSPLEAPAALFAAAETEGLLIELDTACRRAAMSGAQPAVLHPDFTLFVNVEPGSLAAGVPTIAGDLDGRRVVLEVTERAVIDSPATLLVQASAMRAAGVALALDDIGVDPRSLALLPLLRPETVKLDLSLIQTRNLEDTARTATAVRAHSERYRTSVVAEGIETAEHEENAIALGAQYGQGWRFGRPGPLPPEAAHPIELQFEVPERAEPTSAPTPWGLLTRTLRPRRASLQLLVRLSRAIENQAISEGESAVIISTFQDESVFTPETRARYRSMAQDAAFVGAIGVGLAEEPEPGVRGAGLGLAEPLYGEWDVCATGPYFAGAFSAYEIEHDADGGRVFEFVITHDRDLVVEAAHILMLRVAPRSSQARPAA